MNMFFDLVWENFPGPFLIAWLLPVSIGWTVLALYIAGQLKSKWNWPTGYTRKVVHVAVFSGAAIVQYFFSIPGVFVLGGAITLVTLYIIYKGDGYLLYEAVAREKDAPYRSLHLLLPYLATFLAGMMCNVLFPPHITAVGYLVTGLGDAAGEPVGTRWGKHRYRVLSWKGMKSYRTLEGSMGVFVASLLALIIGYQLWEGAIWHVTTFFMLLASALICALIEAISPHGLDNFFSLTGGCIVSYFLLF